jgi:hypothetical protein
MLFGKHEVRLVRLLLLLREAHFLLHVHEKPPSGAKAHGHLGCICGTTKVVP